MARVNYREVTERFTHLDGEFVSFEGRLPDGGATFAVRYYAWWEHPEVGAAIRENRAWGMKDAESGAKVVTLHALRVLEFKMSQGDEVERWGFFGEHHLLWPYEEKGIITCNSPLALETALELVEAAASNVGAPTSAMWRHVDHRNIRRYGRTPPFVLGNFPRPAFFAIRDQLREREIEFLTTYEPTRDQVPVLFLINGDDYIIAEDFEVDIPEFEHRPELVVGDAEGVSSRARDDTSRKPPR
jgi:hypothetical protein